MASEPGDAKHTSKYVGISYDTSKQKYRAEIYANARRIHIGYFDDEAEAASSYDEYAVRMGRPVNFPEKYSGISIEDLPKLNMNSGVRRKTRKKSGRGQDDESDYPEGTKSSAAAPEGAPFDHQTARHGTEWGLKATTADRGVDGRPADGRPAPGSLRGGTPGAAAAAAGGAPPERGGSGRGSDGGGPRFVKEGRWASDEHGRFLEGLDRFDKKWERIAEHVGTRNVLQVRSHAQKYFLKLTSGRAQLERKDRHFDRAQAKPPPGAAPQTVGVSNEGVVCRSTSPESALGAAGGQPSGCGHGATRKRPRGGEVRGRSSGEEGPRAGATPASPTAQHGGAGASAAFTGPWANGAQAGEVNTLWWRYPADESWGLAPHARQEAARAALFGLGDPGSAGLSQELLNSIYAGYAAGAA
eukprot:CAMPEP_0172651224 /NCGR_PEP_ID=MMETSP1068-20121228/242696_1 /TAXON_ID=35684 /ORGANISM="Pseudopedinella elastica, Strain CCMP716" /LENGTH=413 /DNA_ID=CAMNT_0013465609 /DNA_START=195 /DNA_END=1432 /DNA_ORIENTATION=+